MKRLLLALVTILLYASTAHAAGVEYWNIWASDLDYDNGFFYGCAPSTPAGPYHGGAVKNFYGSDISCNNLPPFASAKIDLPPYLTAPVVLSCGVYGQTPGADPSRQIEMQFAIAASPAVSTGTPDVYDNNPGYVPGLLSSTISGAMIATEETTTYQVIKTSVATATVYDQSTGLAWVPVNATTTAPPARIYFQRTNTVANNEGAVFQFIKAVCTAPTN